MKYFKLLSLAWLAAVSMLLLAGAATSSATVLCKTTATPCESAYGKEAVIKASMSGTAVLTNTESKTLATCTSGSAELELTQPEASEVVGAVTASSLTWGGCSVTTDTIAGGEISIKHISGTDNGTVVAKGFEITVLQKSISCTYGAGGGIDLGVLRGRENPTIEINAVVNKQAGSFECPSDALWKAKYELSEPLYAEPGSETPWCKTTTRPCNSSYEAEAAFKTSAPGSIVLESLGGGVEGTCTGGTLKGVLATTGGDLGSMPMPIESLTWSGCSNTTDTLRTGELDLTPITGTDNATVSYTGTEVTYILGGVVSCGYGGNGGDIGTFKGGEKPTIEVSAILTKSSGSFICPKEDRWTAEYKVEEPTPLYVESS